MSSYLNRLSMRTQVTSDPQQVLQPFVRSTSPIAEQDQRIGMAGFEDIEFGVAPHAESDPEVEVEQSEVLRGSMPPRITAANNPGVAMVQRKMAGSTADSASLIPSSAPAPIADNSLESRDRPALGKTTVQSNTPALPMPEQLAPLDTALNPTEQGNLRQASTESSSLSRLAEPEDSPHSSQMDQLLYSPKPQSFLRQTPRIPQAPVIVETRKIADIVPPARVRAIASETHDTGLEATPSAAPTADASAAIPDPDNFPSRDTAQSVELKEVRPRTVRQTQGVDTPSLEPATSVLANSGESLFEVMPFSRLNETVSPQVVIGRIDVEVVPPPAMVPPTETSRSDPLTAASVSVIGSLGGRMRSNVRFSLRQR